MRTKCQIIVVWNVLVLVTICEAAETPFFWDDFEGRTGDILLSEEATGPWTLGVSLDENAWFDSGDLVLEPLFTDEIGSVFKDTPAITNFRIESTISFPETARRNSRPFIMAIYADERNRDFDWGGIDAQGRLQVGTMQDLHSPFQLDLAEDEIRSADIRYRLEAFDDMFEARVWIDGDGDEVDSISWERSLEHGTAFGIAVNPQGLAPEESQVRIRNFAVLPYLNGDFNASDNLDAEDIDLTSAELRGEASNRVFDLTGDASVNSADHEMLVTELFGTWYGDSNLDGEFNSGDFVTVFAAGEYEDNFPDNSTWSTGDWNGDGDFDSGDFVTAFADGGYEKGTRRALVTVPEPRLSVLWLLVCLSVSQWRRRTKGHGNNK